MVTCVLSSQTRSGTTDLVLSSNQFRDQTQDKVPLVVVKEDELYGLKIRQTRSKRIQQE